MKAIILCAGYATRLYPLTKDKPKPLLEVGGKAIVEHILENISALEDLDKVYIVTNNKFHTHFEEWAKELSYDKEIVVVNDMTLTNETRLGAIGDINFVLDKEKLDDDLLVIGGDNLFKFRLQEAGNLFKEKGASTFVVYDTGDIELSKQYGIVEIDDVSKVVGFVEKPENPPSTLASTAVYFFKKDDVKKITEFLEEGNEADKLGNFIDWLYKKVPVYAYVAKERWYDIGSFKELEVARKDFS